MPTGDDRQNNPNSTTQRRIPFSIQYQAIWKVQCVENFFGETQIIITSKGDLLPKLTESQIP